MPLRILREREHGAGARGVAARRLSLLVAGWLSAGWVSAACALAACGGGTTTLDQPPGAAASDEPNAGSEQGASAPERTTRELLPESTRCELPAPGYGDECNTCLAARCCEPLEACKGDTTCGAQLACVVRCQSADNPGNCSLACLGDSPAPGYGTFDDCSFTECLMPCWN